MKKFLSISFCLLLCLSLTLIFSACKEKSKPVAEAAAMESLNVAIENLNNEKAVKMSYNFLGEKMIMVVSENINYSYITDTLESWAIKEGELYHNYTISNNSIWGESGYQYVKTASPAIDKEGVFDSEILEDFDFSLDDLSEMEFVKASEFKGVLSVEFEILLF